jgi:hypothetical protein
MWCGDGILGMRAVALVIWRFLDFAAENGFGMDAEADAEWDDDCDCFLQESLAFRLVFGFVVSFSLSSDDDNGSGRLFLRFRFLTFIFCFGCVFFRSKISSESSDESKSMVWFAVCQDDGWMDGIVKVDAATKASCCRSTLSKKIGWRLKLSPTGGRVN